MTGKEGKVGEREEEDEKKMIKSDEGGNISQDGGLMRVTEGGAGWRR